MSSITLGKRQWNSRWDDLPREIRLLILEALIQDGCTLARLATVSREWRAEFERFNFARIRLTPSRLVNFSAMTHRNGALVRYIWFCLELDDYDCTRCAPTHRTLTEDEVLEAFIVSDTDHCPITTAFEDLFSALSTWDPNGDLVLDISIYSPSDSKHWFKYLTFMPDTPLEMLGGGAGDITEQTMLNGVFNDPQHGWAAGPGYSAPLSAAVRKIFHPVMDDGPFDSDQLENQWWDQLPSVPAVTGLLLRQQNSRRWKPGALGHMFARFPRLQEVHYEPWREWDCMQRHTDRHYRYLFESLQRSNNNLRRLVVFENFNQQYPAFMRRFLEGVEMTKCDIIRKPSPAISRAVALASFKLDHLAASFIVDASHFFEIEPSWEWPNLTSLVLTSGLLTPDEDTAEIEAMLQAAATAAMKMPQLKTMEIWNGRKGLAALFKYQAFRNIERAIITWRAVVHQYVDWRLDLVQEQIDESAIKSHGDAIHFLMLSNQVIRPVSLQQIRMEQKILKDVAVV
ncbi:hypothetical protein F5Y01DRAFT_306650 [Xylaria sp. FL0043]|nr:hypothetical protein F5Y01DRAFT_306650 [Xylaria sp. FL0043]